MKDGKCTMVDMYALFLLHNLNALVNPSSISSTKGVTHVHGRMKKLQRDREKDSSSDRNNQELHVFTLSEYTLRCTNPRGVETPRSLEISPNNIHNIASPPLPLRSQRRSR